jgi:site-specific DNA-methyltransferase (adenine-specific)
MTAISDIKYSPKSEVHLLDCMEGMKGFPDKYFELCICDPQYGLGEGQKKVNSRATVKVNKKWPGRRAPQYGGGEWDDAIPTPEYFQELKRVSKHQIIWGANHFGNQEPSSGWVVWFKKRFDEVNDFSDCELAYTSFQKGCRMFHLPWIGFGAINAGEDRIHPTQKPVALYKWLLKNYAKPGDKILDTHMGSQSSRIAAFDMGHDYTGFEIDPDYFKAGCERFENFKKQLKLF